MEGAMSNNSLKEHLLAIIKKSKEVTNAKLDKKLKSLSRDVDQPKEEEKQHQVEEQTKSLKVLCPFTNPAGTRRWNIAF